MQITEFDTTDGDHVITASGTFTLVRQREPFRYLVWVYGPRVFPVDETTFCRLYDELRAG